MADIGLLVGKGNLAIILVDNPSSSNINVGRENFTERDKVATISPWSPSLFIGVLDLAITLFSRASLFLTIRVPRRP